MKSPEFSRREFFTRLVDRSVFFDGLPKFPAPPEYPKEGKIASLAAIASMAGVIRVSRRLFLVASGITALGFELEKAMADISVQVEKVDSEIAGGNQSFPWNPLDERVDGLVSTGRNPGGAFDKADQIEQLIYGEKARSLWWKPLRQWDAEIAEAVVIKEDVYDDKGNLIVRANWRQAGFCAYGASASILSSRISGPISILGIELNEFERKQIATMFFGGILRDPVFTRITADVIGVVRDDYFPKGVPIIVNYTPIPYEDWWGSLSGIAVNGDFIITRPMNHKDGDGALIKTSYNPSSLKQIAVLNPGQVQLGEEGAAVFIDPVVAGLVMGNLRIVS